MKKYLLIILITLSVLGIVFLFIENGLKGGKDKVEISNNELGEQEQKKENKSQLDNHNYSSDNGIDDIILDNNESEAENLSAVPEENYCDQECNNFKDEAENEKCMKICGFSETTEASENCDDLYGQEKDFCWRNSAIEEKNYSSCDNIIDETIKENCKNQVTERIFDSMGEGVK